MNLEPIIQSEVSQKENDKYCILMHIYGTLKNLFMGQQWRNRHREQTYGHGERGGEGEMYGESNMETYMTISKWIANGNLLNVPGNSNRDSVPTQRVGCGGKQREVQEGGDKCVPVADSC